MTKLLFNITHGFQARMLLRSAISETLLASGASLIVVSRAANEPYFRQEFAHPQVALEEMPSRFSRVEANLITLRQYLLMNPSLGGTLNYKNEAFRRQAPKRYWFARSGNLLLGHITPLRNAYIKTEAKLFAGREYDELLLRHKPDLVVTGTAGYNPDDIHLLRAARRLHIPTATVVLSWDNLTSKGYMGAVPDHLLVWSTMMADEATHYHDFPRDRIRWCGAAQFDHYYGLRDRLDRAAWRRTHGVAEDSALIVYGTINPALLPHEINVLRAIVADMRAGKFSRKPHLWIRLHPQVIRGHYSRSLEPFRQLAGPDVTVEEPRVQSDKLDWDLPKDDAAHLAALMAAADIVVTPGSTLMIDAICAGTPVVNILYDGHEAVDPALSARRFKHYVHHGKLLEAGGIAVALDMEEFVDRVNGYLVDPDRDRAGREAVIRQQLNILDGNAGTRTAAELLAIAEDGRRTNYAPRELAQPT